MWSQPTASFQTAASHLISFCNQAASQGSTTQRGKCYVHSSSCQTVDRHPSLPCVTVIDRREGYAFSPRKQGQFWRWSKHLWLLFPLQNTAFLIRPHYLSYQLIFSACNVLYLNSVETESLTGPQAVAKATGVMMSLSPRPAATMVHFKVSTQGITLTDSQRRYTTCCTFHFTHLLLKWPLTSLNISLPHSHTHFI